MILKIGKSHLYCRAIEIELQFKTVLKAGLSVTFEKFQRNKTGTFSKLKSMT